jgi:hypothetical protein
MKIYWAIPVAIILADLIGWLDMIQAGSYSLTLLLA